MIPYRLFIIWAFTRDAFGNQAFHWRGFGFHRLPQCRSWRLRLGLLILGGNVK